MVPGLSASKPTLEMMHTNEQVIDIMVDNLFRAAVIDKDEFHRKAKQNIRKTFDAYVHPFTISEEDRMHRVGMRSIMSSPLDPSAAWKPILLGMNFVAFCFRMRFFLTHAKSLQLTFHHKIKYCRCCILKYQRKSCSICHL